MLIFTIGPLARIPVWRRPLALLSPVLDQYLRFQQRRDDPPVEQLISQLPVEGLYGFLSIGQFV